MENSFFMQCIEKKDVNTSIYGQKNHPYWMQERSEKELEVVEKWQ